MSDAELAQNIERLSQLVSGLTDRINTLVHRLDAYHIERKLDLATLETNIKDKIDKIKDKP